MANSPRLTFNVRLEDLVALTFFLFNLLLRVIFHGIEGQNFSPADVLIIIPAVTLLLAKEMVLTRLRDELSQKRHDLPWEPVDKAYVSEGENGKEALAEQFASRSHLIAYHFIFAPAWEARCKRC